MLGMRGFAEATVEGGRREGRRRRKESPKCRGHFLTWRGSAAEVVWGVEFARGEEGEECEGGVWVWVWV